MPDDRAAFPGARFYKADLHVHTSASKCWRWGRDGGEMKRIFDKFRAEGLEVVGITDHNTAANVDIAKKVGKEFGIRVYPGVEVSTKEGHALALFDPSKSSREINDWLSFLGITGNLRGSDGAMARDQEGEPLSISRVFKLIEQHGGIAIAPHPNTKSIGFLEVLRPKGAARQAAYASSDLRALEAGADQAKVLELASGKVGGYPKKYACIASSDAHAIDEIGTTFTYIKLGDFGIGALKQAFYDPSMRIRFSAQWPPKKHAWIASLATSEGFFENVEFQLHPDMNSLVGGKAVGKSLAIDLMRYALGIDSPIAEINEEVRSKVASPTCLGEGGTVILHVVSDNDEHYRIERTFSEFDEGPQVYFGNTQTKAAETVREVFDCEVYSQNEVIELGKRLPALLDWLDGFVDLSREIEEIRRLSQEMKAVLRELDNAHVAAMPRGSLQKRRTELQAKKKLLEEKVKEPILKAFPKWLKEERELKELQGGLTRLVETVVGGLEAVKIKEYLPKLDPNTPNSRAIEEQRAALLGLEEAIGAAAKTLRQAAESKEKSLALYAKNWQKKYDRAKEEYAAVISSAGVKNASAVTSELNRATKRIEQVERELTTANKAHRKEIMLRKELRGNLMPSYNQCFAAIYKKRMKKAADISKALGGFVRIQVRQMTDRTEFENKVVLLARGSGLRRPTLQQFVNALTPLEFAECLADRDIDRLTKKATVGKEQASALIEGAWSKARDADRTEVVSKLYDTVFTQLRDEVLVELRLADGTYKPMHELSVGSKCTAILSVALIEGESPLIVDQPEDALDSPFVFEQIVQTVRRSKTGRQYLFATHNPNVAVGSDADLIYCLTATAVEGSVDRYGSVDEMSTRDRVVANLEGGGDAFRLRSQKYDIVVHDPNAVVFGPLS